MTASSNSDWWMFHGDPAHTGFVSQSRINRSNVATLTSKTLQIGGPILSVPAVALGHVFVGIANSTKTPAAQGGALYKIRLSDGATVASYGWPTASSEGDTHGFTGMGCTPAVVGPDDASGRVYFSAFDGKLYCLRTSDLSEVWVTDLRHADPAHEQPMTNTAGTGSGGPQAEGWSSPLVVDGRVYVGIGEGENPDLYAFVFCLDAVTGNVVWIYCTCKYTADQDNAPNVLPAEIVTTPLPQKYSVHHGGPIVKGCVVWSAIAYDRDLDRIFCTTGNPQPESDDDSDPPALPAPGYAYGLLALDAKTGAFEGFYQADKASSYRVTDIDIDFGGSPTIYTREGRKVAAIACKNGGLFLVDLETMTAPVWRQLLPYQNCAYADSLRQLPPYADDCQIETIDPHGPDTATNPNPRISNAESNKKKQENFHGTYSTPAVHPELGRLYVGVGGNNYHYIAAGIDSNTTPFMRALDSTTLVDAWALDDGDPRRYIKPRPPMYTVPGEAGLSSPAVVNDVVFCSTSKIAIHAFDASDGTLLWSDDLGEQTGGFNGGYGYCLGPAIAGDYVVAGALVMGRDGGILRIYQLPS
jgi:outer membrane protein assembly factor BamB